MARMMLHATNWRDDYYTLSEIARAVDVSESTIKFWYMIRNSELYYVKEWWEGLYLPPQHYKDRKVGIRYAKKDVEDFIKFREAIRSTHRGVFRLFSRTAAVPRKDKPEAIKKLREKFGV